MEDVEDNKNKDEEDEDEEDEDSDKSIINLLENVRNELFLLTATGSAVNELTYANAAASGDPSFTATGGDTNIGITLATKGTGVIQLTSSMNPTISTTGKAMILGF